MKLELTLSDPQSRTPGGGHDPAAPDLDRLSKVYRRWSAARKHLRQTEMWRLPLPTACGRHGFWIGAASSLLLIPFSQAIVPIGSVESIPPLVTLLPFRPRLLMALVLLWLVNSWLIDRHLAQRTPRETEFEPWLLRLRFLISGVPLLGLYAIPAWGWVVRTRPAWATREPPQSAPVVPPGGRSWPRLALIRRLAARIRRRLASELSIGLLTVGTTVALFPLVWLETSVDPTPAQRWFVGGWAVLFHLIAFLGMFCHLLDESRRAKASKFNRYSYLLYSLFWLLPIPYFALAGLIGLGGLRLLIDFSPQEKTLVYKAYANRYQTMNLPLWLRLEETLRRRWPKAPLWERLHLPPRSSPRPVALGDASTWRFRLYRGKTMFLAFDAMALVWIAKWLADHYPGVRMAIEIGLEIVTDTSLALCILGLLVMVVYFIRLAARSPGLLGILDQHPYAQYLAATQVAFLGGLAAGEGLYAGDPEWIAAVLKVIGGLCGMAAFAAFCLRIFLPGGERVKRPDRNMILAMLGFSLIGMLGSNLKDNEETGRMVMEWMKALAITCPVWGILLGRVYRRWLLWPFEARHVFSPQRPPAVRWALFFLTATLILPLGGLAIPFWIYIHHRKMPAWGKDYLEEREGAGDR